MVYDPLRVCCVMAYDGIYLGCETALFFRGCPKYKNNADQSKNDDDEKQCFF